MPHRSQALSHVCCLLVLVTPPSLCRPFTPACAPPSAITSLPTALLCKQCGSTVLHCTVLRCTQGCMAGYNFQAIQL